MARWPRSLGALLWLWCTLVVSAAPAAAVPLVVSAAASLSNSMRELAAQFERQNPGVRVVCNFASSGVLLRQLQHGAPADVLAAADRDTLDRAQAAGLLRSGTRSLFASNALVLVATPQVAARGLGLAELRTRSDVLLAVGNPGFVPAGRYARQALAEDGSWALLRGRLVYGNSVRQVLDYVARGEVGAGVVYATDVAVAGDRVRLVGHLSGHEPIVYPAAVTAYSRAPEPGRQFVDFLCGSVGQAILARHGFAPPPAGGRGRRLSSQSMDSSDGITHGVIGRH